MKFMWLMILLLSILSGIPGHASEPGARFLIERIRIENAKRVSPTIILSETHLKQGSEYSEIDLKRAMDRLVRLPFVLDTTFSLEKGSARGRFVLVIHVVETRMLFFNLGSNRREFDDESFTDEILDFGGRWFLGPSGVLFASFSPNIQASSDLGKVPTFSAGYSQYNLFNKNIYANFTASYTYGKKTGDGFRPPSERLEDNLSAALTLGIPLVGNQWLRTSVTWSEMERRRSFLEEPRHTVSIRKEETLDARIFWEFNTLNDSFLPTDGTLLQGGIAYSDTNDTSLPNEEPSLRLSQEGYGWSVTTSYRRYHEFGRHSFNYGAQSGLGRNQAKGDLTTGENLVVQTRIQGDSWTGHFLLGYSVDIWGRKATARHGDFRFEISTNYEFTGDLNYNFGVSTDEDGNTVITNHNFSKDEVFLYTGLTYRSSFGVVRIGARYEQ